KWRSCFEPNHWIHGSSFLFVFPAELILRLRVRKETKNAAGKNPPPDSDPFNVRSFYGNPSGFVYSNFYVGYCLTIGYPLRDLLCMFNSPAPCGFESENTVSISSAHNETLAVAV